MKSLLCSLAIITSSTFASIDANYENIIKIDQLYQHGKVTERFTHLIQTWTTYQQNENPEFLIEKLIEAANFAAEKHLGQHRKGASKTPYIILPFGVQEILWKEGKVRSANILISALLQDVLEDTDTTEAEITDRFGPRVLYIVKELTNDPDLTSAQNKQRQVDHVPFMSHDAQLVTIADRIYNVRDLDRTPPPSWDEADKLLGALGGVHGPLEKALQAEIDHHQSAKN